MSNHRMVFTTYKPMIVKCPFCGHPPTLFMHKAVGQRSARNSYFIKCEECGATTAKASSMALALEGWNKRADAECLTTFI